MAGGSSSRAPRDQIIDKGSLGSCTWSMYGSILYRETREVHGALTVPLYPTNVIQRNTEGFYMVSGGGYLSTAKVWLSLYGRAERTTTASHPMTSRLGEQH